MFKVGDVVKLKHEYVPNYRICNKDTRLKVTHADNDSFYFIVMTNGQKKFDPQRVSSVLPVAEWERVKRTGLSKFVEMQEGMSL